MLDSKIQDALNKHLNAEFFSSYLYLSMSSYFESRNLKGMAHWMQIQTKEELHHAMKFLDFIHERGGRVHLMQVEGPKTEWSSPLDVLEEACAHESKITGLINELVELSMSKKDHAASTFLQWFVTEQVEEEATVREIADKLRLVGDNTVALFMIDKELGDRVFQQ
jgi:ferritin